MKYNITINYGYNLHKAGKLTMTDENGKVLLDNVAVSIPYKENNIVEKADGFIAKKLICIQHEVSPERIAEINEHPLVQRYLKLFNDIARRDELSMVVSSNADIIFAPDNAGIDEAIVTDPDFFLLRKEDYTQIFFAANLGEIEVRTKKRILNINGEDVFVDLNNNAHSTKDKIVELNKLRKEIGFGILTHQSSLIPYKTPTPFNDITPYYLYNEKRPKLQNRGIVSNLKQLFEGSSFYNDKPNFPLRQAEANLIERERKDFLHYNHQLQKSKSEQRLFSALSQDPAKFEAFKGAALKPDTNETYLVSALFPQQAVFYLPGSPAAQYAHMKTSHDSTPANSTTWTGNQSAVVLSTVSSEIEKPKVMRKAEDEVRKMLKRLEDVRNSKNKEHSPMPKEKDALDSKVLMNWSMIKNKEEVTAKKKNI